MYVVNYISLPLVGVVVCTQVNNLHGGEGVSPRLEDFHLASPLFPHPARQMLGRDFLMKHPESSHTSRKQHPEVEISHFWDFGVRWRRK